MVRTRLGPSGIPGDFMNFIKALANFRFICFRAIFFILHLQWARVESNHLARGKAFTVPLASQSQTPSP